MTEFERAKADFEQSVKNIVVIIGEDENNESHDEY